MQLPPSLRDLLNDPRVRLGFAAVIAFFWYVLTVAGEAGRNPAPVAVIGIPAVLVLLWWRARPWAAIVLAAVVLVLIPLIILSGSPSAGLIPCAATGWFAIVGACVGPDRRMGWAATALAAGYMLIVLVGTFGEGGQAALLLFITAFFIAIAFGLGWAWRQLRASGRLRSTLAETTVKHQTAERDVLLELERNRIAREVHDVVAHSLAVVIAQADGARFAAETKPETVAPALEAISDTARRALGEVRTMLHDLRTSGEAGVVPGPEDLAGLVSGIRALDVEVDDVIFGEPRPLDERTGLALYRIAQEALTNAMRHGDRAEPVGFEVDWGEREVVLVVTNAVPAQAVPASERAGHGVTGMRERAADAGGDCTASTGSNGRFRVRVALPVPREPDPATGSVADEQANPLAALLTPLLDPRA